MFDLIYVEDAVADHPRTRSLLGRYPGSRVIRCERHGEVFNRSAQDFRLQKRRPALIIAEKHGQGVLEAPRGYGLGREVNYYFSHVLNCVYDCRYCFLQGMYRSAHLVLFINYELFLEQLDAVIEEHPPGSCTFFSGYDGDSLALEPLTEFVAEFLPFFHDRPGAQLELRTKSARVEALLEREPLENCVVAFSLSPEGVGEALEAGVPPLARRLSVARELQRRGWPVGLRFDPLIHARDWREQYTGLFEAAFEALDPSRLHSVSLGSFRLPRATHRKLERLFPEEPLLAHGLEDRDGLVGYHRELQEELESFCTERVLEHLPADRFFPCDGRPSSRKSRATGAGGLSS